MSHKILRRRPLPYHRSPSRAQIALTSSSACLLTHYSSPSTTSKTRTSSTSQPSSSSKGHGASTRSTPRGSRGMKSQRSPQTSTRREPTFTSTMIMGGALASRQTSASNSPFWRTVGLHRGTNQGVIHILASIVSFILSFVTLSFVLLEILGVLCCRMSGGVPEYPARRDEE